MQTGVDRVLTLNFGLGGNEGNYLGAGWSDPEPGCRWMTGRSSLLWLEHPGADHDLILEIDFRIVPIPANEPRQILAIGVRDHAIAHVVATQDGVLGFHIPAATITGPGPVRLAFLHPDCKRPAEAGLNLDDRHLSFCIRSMRLHRVLDRPIAPGAKQLPPRELVTRFESLGDNCEFGLLQRMLDVEPLGLFRFSFIKSPALLRGLHTGFDGLGTPNTISVTAEGPNREFIIREAAFGMHYHTFQHENETDKDTVRLQQSKRLDFLRRKLMEDVSAGRKIFVIKRSPRPLSAEEMLPIYVALNEFSPNWLLWVLPADEANLPGTVQSLLPGLLRGNIDRFAPLENAPDLSMDSWLAICDAAWQVAGRTLGE